MMVKLSSIVRDILDINKELISVLKTVKIDAHQDDLKQRRKISPLENMNVEYDKEAKKLIRQIIESWKNTPLLFTLSSPVILTTENRVLSSVNGIRKAMHFRLS